MKIPFKPGSARRLGLRRVHEPMTLAQINTPGQTLWAVAGVNGRSWLANERGSAVAKPGVAIGAGMIQTERESPIPNWVSVRGVEEPWRLSGRG